MTDTQKSKAIPILMYHSISEHANSSFRRYTVAPGLFSEHMAYLVEQGYTAMTVSEFVRGKQQTESALPERPVVVTFDDGYEDFYTSALPLLRRYKLPATLFIATGLVAGERRSFENDAERQFMTWEEIAEVNASGIECGGHTHAHYQLDLLPGEQSFTEIVQCKQILEDKLACDITSFAYPFGRYTNAIKQMVREAGYSCACAVRYTLSATDDDPFALARRLVGPDTTVDDLAVLLTQPESAVMQTIRHLTRPLSRMKRRYAAWRKGGVTVR